jgi:hypothetical protein
MSVDFQCTTRRYIPEESTRIRCVFPEVSEERSISIILKMAVMRSSISHEDIDYISRCRIPGHSSPHGHCSENFISWMWHKGER